MLDEKINQKYLKKIKLFQKYNKNYYDLNNPLVNDQEFDKLKLEIIRLEKKYKYLSNINSPSNSVGFKPSKIFKKVKHSVPMLSLGNAFDLQDLEDFDTRIRRFLSLDDAETITYTSEPKIDGLSASLRYENGVFISGATRGDGQIGEDITENLKTLKDVPITLPKGVPDIVEIRGEVYMAHDDFKALNRQQSEKAEGTPSHHLTLRLDNHPYILYHTILYFPLRIFAKLEVHLSPTSCQKK